MSPPPIPGREGRALGTRRRAEGSQGRDRRTALSGEVPNRSFCFGTAPPERATAPSGDAPRALSWPTTAPPKEPVEPSGQDRGGWKAAVGEGEEPAVGPGAGRGAGLAFRNSVFGGKEGRRKKKGGRGREEAEPTARVATREAEADDRMGRGFDGGRTSGPPPRDRSPRRTRALAAAAGPRTSPPSGPHRFLF